MQNWGEALKIFESERYCVKTEGCGGSGTFNEQLNMKETATGRRKLEGRISVALQFYSIISEIPGKSSQT